jgi:hypothetical protein
MRNRKLISERAMHPAHAMMAQIGNERAGRQAGALSPDPR